MHISMEVFCKLMLWFLMEMVKHSQSSEYSKFAMSLQYPKREVREEVDFLHTDQNFPQVNFTSLSIKVFYKVILSLLMDMIKHYQSTQSNRLSIALQYLKNEVSHKAFQ